MLNWNTKTLRTNPSYRISLISRICFTNYRNFKSSLLPLAVFEIFFAFRLFLPPRRATYDSNYVTPPGKAEQATLMLEFFVLREHKKYFLMWQIHGNLSLIYTERGWFILEMLLLIFYDCTFCSVRWLQPPPALDFLFVSSSRSQSTIKTNIWNLLLIVARTHVKSVEGTTREKWVERQQEMKYFCGATTKTTIHYSSRFLERLECMQKHAVSFLAGAKFQHAWDQLIKFLREAASN